MPATDVRWPIPLIRQKIFYPGQFGVPGTDTERGLRSHVTGAIFYVDPNAPGAVTNRDGTDPEAPLSTVASALALCQPYRGDVVCVMANNSWQYGDPTDGYTTAISEEVTVSVPGVRLVGVCPAGQGVYWYPASDGGRQITVSAIDVTIEGFFFSEGPTYTGCDAIYAEWDNVTLFADNLTVRNCVFDDTVDTAIQLELSWYCDIHHNLFWGCDEYGVYVDPAGSGIAYSLFHDNVFHDCVSGALYLRAADFCQIYRNSIFNSDAQAGAPATDEGITTEGGHYNQVYHNILSCLLPAAAPGDYDDFCTPDVAGGVGYTDSWIHNYCLNGPSVTTPT